MKDSLWWQLLRVFVPLSLLTIGGGQSILADVQQQSVSVHHWLTQDQFLDDFAISRASAGPNTLIVTLIGWQVAGISGAVAATLAIFLPSSILFYGLTRLWRLHAFTRWRDRFARGLAPVSVGLVFAGTYSVLTRDGGGLLGWVVSAASLLALLLSKVHPLILLVCGAAIFLCKSQMNL
jgi:chromate transporter